MKSLRKHKPAVERRAITVEAMVDLAGGDQQHRTR
jgi:hypothetical protein